VNINRISTRTLADLKIKVAAADLALKWDDEACARRLHRARDCRHHRPFAAQTILDANYFHRDQALAESAMRKLETRFGNKKVATENEPKTMIKRKDPKLAIELALPAGMGRG
jgi:hypothetical protein